MISLSSSLSSICLTNSGESSARYEQHLQCVHGNRGRRSWGCREIQGGRQKWPGRMFCSHKPQLWQWVALSIFNCYSLHLCLLSSSLSLSPFFFLSPSLILFKLTASIFTHFHTFSCRGTALKRDRIHRWLLSPVFSLFLWASWFFIFTFHSLSFTFHCLALSLPLSVYVFKRIYFFLFASFAVSRTKSNIDSSVEDSLILILLTCSLSLDPLDRRRGDRWIERNQANFHWKTCDKASRWWIQDNFWM